MISFLKIDIANNRIFGLDILRCLAILFVVFGHGNLFFSSTTAKYLDYFVLDGVSIFFVLSGYLIGGILIKELENKPFSKEVLFSFWKRRWYRTLPNYFLVLTFLVFLSYSFSNNFQIANSIKYYIFSQNLYYPHPNWFPEAWSLSIEEWFYLIVPIILLIIIKSFNTSAKKAILITAVLVILAATLFRYIKSLEIVLENSKDWDINFRKQVFTRIDSIMYGVTGSYIAYYYNNLWYKYKKIMFALGLILLLYNKFFIKSDLNSLHACVFTFSLNSIGTLLLLPFLSEIKTGKGKIYKVVTYISLISYSMYLLNLTLVKNWIVSNIEIDLINSYITLLIKYILYWFFTIVLSILLYKYFEIPTTKLRDR
ncbi:acyltransferase family protein [Flavobacterium foetidum]|uniref:acyltransferase family protein n=1 Tax=Flavobacterium foetidum TaxID=2026681 RepID=UPI0010757143|nr:acyltransferase [Flavobacterium foetidum]KAF2516608.1 acyltransferase [Flavobacterium foetidum]